MYPPTSTGLSDPNSPWMPRKQGFSLFGDPSTFTAAAGQQGSDYDEIMKQYNNLINNFSSNPLTTNPINYSSINPGSPITSRPLNSPRPVTSNPLDPGNPLSYESVKNAAINSPRSVNFNPLTAKISPYEQSKDVTDSLARLKDLVDTGGYSAADIQNIRDRDTSPIRSIYASGKQNLERQRALSGGYSPNFNAVSASMARDEASKIGDITARANADIAQNVASNKLAAASPYASMSASANASRAAADQRNADIINQINEYNASNKANIDEFNTTTGLNVDRYNRDTQLGLDLSNRDFRRDTDRYNRDTQLGVNRENRNTQLDLDRENRNLQLGLERENRDTQLGLDKSNRDFQFGVENANREAQLGTDKFNIDNLVRTTGMNRNDILEAIRGRASLYGTTPALTNTFGNQVLQAGQLGQGQQDINARRRAMILGFAGRG